jgi:predicted PurR-regulated permease PerM
MSKPAGNPFERFLNNSRLIRYLLLFALGWAIIQILAYFQTVIVIFVFAATLAFLLNYPVQWLKKYTRHSIAVVFVFLTSLILLTVLSATFGLAVISEFQEFLQKTPEIVQSILSVLNQIETWLEDSNIPVNFSFLQQELQRQITSTLSFSTAFLRKLLTSFVELIIILVVAFFMLLDGQKIWQYIVQLFPSQWQLSITNALRDNFIGFLRGRLILSFFFTVSAFCVYLILQTPYPWLLAALGGFFDLIPGIGATIGISLAALIVLPQGVFLSLQVILYCVLLQQIEENVLMPRIMQNSVNLNPVIIFFALLIGVRIAGFLGLFLAIPTAAVIVSFFKLEAMKG